MRYLILLLLFFCLYANLLCSAPEADKDTLLNEHIPQTVDELWKEYDPRAEPLETEILKEWEEDGIVLRIVRYRIGIFKGQKAMMAAVYGYPKGGVKLPGLVQIHGGGQYADYRAVLTNARRGYATISIAWAGRIHAPGYEVDPEGVKLFWDNKTNDPEYRLTTDWGALDAYHAPGRHPDNSFVAITPASWTLDTVESPRNSGWFLCTLAARRALTFLEQQPGIDAEKLGVYGHSMGGKLTVLTAGSDTRVKAAAPSCGGVSDRYSDNELFRATIGDERYLKRISCPIIFLSPSNDFHGSIIDLQKAVKEIKSKEWRVTCSPHHNHQDNPEYMVAGLLWFDQYLKGNFTFPEAPKSTMELKTNKGVPVFTVTPDAPGQIRYVDIYYTWQGREIAERTNIESRINRFWHHATAIKNDDTWTADLPLLDIDKPVWAYANVVYQLDSSITGAGYYYSVYTADTYCLSSVMHVATPSELKAAGLKATLKPSLMIETFRGDWQKEWFTYKPETWARQTHKLHDGQWKAPEGAKLVLEVRSEQANKMVVRIDQFATEIRLTGGSEWQQFILSYSDFHNATGNTLSDWKDLKELSLLPMETLKENDEGKNNTLQLGAEWQGAKPEFRNLRWMTNGTF